MFSWLKRQPPHPLLPTIELSFLLPQEISVTIREPDTKDGNVSFGELIVIAQLVKRRQPRKIFEIGTFDGRTTLNLAANTSENTKVFTLDLPQGMTVETSAGGDKKFMGKVKTGARFKDRDEERKITQLFGDSAKFDFSPYKNSMDFIFVDGSHAYEYTLKDSESALLMAKPGTVILWHDYAASWPGVTRALNELYQSDSHFKNLKHINGTSLAHLSHR